MRYKIHHTTEYKYQEMVTTGHNRLCLVPLNCDEQSLLSSEIKISPTPDELTYITDFFGNTLLFISIYKEHKELVIHSESKLEINNRVNADHAFHSSLLGRNTLSQLSAKVLISSL